MKFLRYAVISAFLMAMPGLANADIIDINPPKPKARARAKPAPTEEQLQAEAAKKNAGKRFEMRVNLGDSQVARDLSGIIVKRLGDYGYKMAPDVLYGDLVVKKDLSDEEKAKLPVFEHTFSFEIVQSSESCFVVCKVVGEDLRQAIWRWETKGSGVVPCELQVQQAMMDYAAKNPPASPSGNAAALEADFQARVAEIEAAAVAKEKAAKEKAEEEAARQKAEAEEFRAKAEAAERELNAQDNYDNYGQDKGLGCGVASGAAAGLPSLLAFLGMGAAIRRRRK